MDGVVGLPGYAGMVSNPMLAHSLITAREAQLHGGVQFRPAPAQRLWPPGRGRRPGRWDLPPSSDPNAVLRLQPNVRALMAGQELLAGLQFEPGQRLRSAKLKSGGANVVTLFVPDVDFFFDQMLLVESHAELRAERHNEILAQVVPQTANWSAIAGLSPETHRYTWEVLGIGLRFAMTVVMRFKHMLNCPRPVEYSPAIQPMILTPGYAAYPSGHATEAYFVAELLPILMKSATRSGSGQAGRADGLAIQLERLAFRVAENRVVAGLHFPVDSLCGRVLGVALAQYFVWRATTATSGLVAWTYPKTRSRRFGPASRSEPRVDEPLDALAEQTPAVRPPSRLDPADVLGKVWSLATGEHGSPFAH
jgi:membrane-associated phospholipid phosphatase